MSKVILVIDDPVTCAGCPLNFWNHCRAIEDVATLLSDYRIESPDTEKLPLCPLRPVPSKINEDAPFVIDYDGGYDHGYNTCIDEILKQ